MMNRPCRRISRELAYSFSEEQHELQVAYDTDAGHQEVIKQGACETSEAKRQQQRQQQQQQKRQQQQLSKSQRRRRRKQQASHASHAEPVCHGASGAHVASFWEPVHHEASEASAVSLQDAPTSQIGATSKIRLSETDSLCSLVVKNTFIDGYMERPLSLDGFFEERRVCSCPNSTIEAPPDEPPLTDEMLNCNRTSARIGSLHAAVSCASRSTVAKGQSYPTPSSEADCPASDEDSSRRGNQQVRGLPDFDYPVPPVMVKNTFLHVGIERSDSLDNFFFERLTQSCPASRLGSSCDAGSAADSQEVLPAGVTVPAVEPLEELASATTVLHCAAATAADVPFLAANPPTGIVPGWRMAASQQQLLDQQWMLANRPASQEQSFKVPARSNFLAPPQKAPVLKISLLQSLELSSWTKDSTPLPAASAVGSQWTVEGQTTETTHANFVCTSTSDRAGYAATSSTSVPGLNGCRAEPASVAVSTIPEAASAVGCLSKSGSHCNARPHF